MKNFPSTQWQKLRCFVKYLFCLMSFIFLSQCGSIQPSQEDTTPISHSLWDNLLHTHVDNDGNVNYEGFLKDREKLTLYLKLISENAPNETYWSKQEQLAYWINAYNAFTIELILMHYPIPSIKEIGSSIQIPFVNTPWDITFIHINGEDYDLNNIEHSILRKNYNEPRIHFAINCASKSCPKLRNEAYTESKLEGQLQEQAMIFINDDQKNTIANDRIEISKIFSWFSGDFEKNGTLIQFLNQYSNVVINEDASITYKNYDWGLNNQ